MKRFKIIVLLLLMMADCHATDVLTEISSRLERAEITEGRFRQEKRIKVLKKPLISTGEFTYHQSRGVIWKTLTPVPSSLLVNQSRLLTSQGEQMLPAAFGRVFTAMLGGNLQGLTEGFDVSGPNPDGSWRLNLKPKDTFLQKIIAGIQLSGEKSLQQVDISEVNGNFTRIRFDRITHPKDLTSAQEADFERLSSPR